MIRYTKIKKVKVDETERLRLEWQAKPADRESWDEYAMTCADQPLPEFDAAFAALTAHVVDMCELPESDLPDGRIEVRGVSFSYGGELEVMGATISASRKLLRSPAPLNLNTPHKASEPYNQDEGAGHDPMSLLTAECHAALRELVKQADLYRSGQRMQTDLFHNETTRAGAPAL